jgi:hypothetical protein
MKQKAPGLLPSNLILSYSKATHHCPILGGRPSTALVLSGTKSVPETSCTPCVAVAAGNLIFSTRRSLSTPAASAFLIPRAPDVSARASAVTNSSFSGGVQDELFQGFTCKMYIVSISSRVRPWCSQRKKYATTAPQALQAAKI